MKVCLFARAACVCVLFVSFHVAAAVDFSVTNSGSSYTINGIPNNPTLTLERGKTYTFSINVASIHPFRINSTGATPNNITSGTITYTVPLAASNYIYECSIHHFFGAINTVAPVAPPVVRILNLSVGTNLVMKSTGTNGWSVVPEFKTNLATTNWFALTVQSNRFINGTNETFCGRPPGNAVFIRVRNQKP